MVKQFGTTMHCIPRIILKQSKGTEHEQEKVHSIGLLCQLFGYLDWLGRVMIMRTEGPEGRRSVRLTTDLY